MSRGSAQDTFSFAVGATIITTADLADDIAYQLVKSVFENHAKFIRLHPAFNDLDKRSMISRSLTAPLHDGAIRYYKEVGLIE